MWPYVALFFASLSVAFSGAAMPGPLLTGCINQTLRRGFWAGPLMIVGHSLLEMVLIAGLIIALRTVLDHVVAKGIIALAGGALLLYLGVGMARSSRTLRLALDKHTPAGRLSSPVWQGIVLSLSNPYWTIWWATWGLWMIDRAMGEGLLFAVSLPVFYLGHILGDFVWYGAVGFMLVKGKRFLSDKAYRGIILGCGIFLIVFGVVCLTDGALLLGTGSSFMVKPPAPR
ncbi:MAG: LysE family transporter [Verrucomicrobia bacterium]|nr:LysE family transporter [Verrucomicrobiota bacterium]